MVKNRNFFVERKFISTNFQPHRDAILNPVIGFLVNKTKTRFGKFRPWY